MDALAALTAATPDEGELVERQRSLEKAVEGLAAFLPKEGEAPPPPPTEAVEQALLATMGFLSDVLSLAPLPELGRVMGTLGTALEASCDALSSAVEELSAAVRERHDPED